MDTLMFTHVYAYINTYFAHIYNMCSLTFTPDYTYLQTWLHIFTDMFKHDHYHYHIDSNYHRPFSLKLRSPSTLKNIGAVFNFTNKFR